VILFKLQIDILLFIGFLHFSINRMFCILFSAHDDTIVHKHLNIKKKLALKDIPILLSYKRFKRFFTSGSSGLLLEIEHLDDLWFATTQL
jgi:hypothetical protein